MIKKKKIKVAVIIGQMTYIGGVGIAAVNEVRELRKLGVEANLVVIFRKEEFDSIRIFGADDIPVIFLSDSLPKWLRSNFRIPGFSFFSFFHLSSIFWLPFVIKKYKYKALVVHETYNSFSAIACARLLKVKLLTYLWDPVSYIIPRIYKRKIPPILFPIILSCSRLIDGFIIKNSNLILLGSGLHEKLVSDIAPASKIIKIPVGTKIQEKIHFNRDPIVIALTKWDKGKNPEFLLEIARKLNGEFKFIIAGNWTDDRQKEEFEKMIETSGLVNIVKVVGKVTEEEKFKLFSQARVLVHPIVEAFGMMALEAAGCGCPFIMPKGSGVTELFIDSKHGYFIPEGDLNTFVSKLNLLINDQKKSAEMGEEAYKMAKNYSWNEHARRINKILNNLFYNP